MRQFPNNDSNEDKNLVQFLKRYRPIAPIAPSNLEHRVMTLISQNDRSSLHIVKLLYKLTFPEQVKLYKESNKGKVALNTGHGACARVKVKTE